MYAVGRACVSAYNPRERRRTALAKKLFSGGGGESAGPRNTRLRNHGDRGEGLLCRRRPAIAAFVGVNAGQVARRVLTVSGYLRLTIVWIIYYGII